MFSKAQRKKEAASKQQVQNQTTASYSMASHSDPNPGLDTPRGQHQADPNLEDSFNRQNSGNNLLDNSAISMGDT